MVYDSQPEIPLFQKHNVLSQTIQSHVSFPYSTCTFTSLILVNHSKCEHTHMKRGNEIFLMAHGCVFKEGCCFVLVRKSIPEKKYRISIEIRILVAYVKELVISTNCCIKITVLRIQLHLFQRADALKILGKFLEKFKSSYLSIQVC